MIKLKTENPLNPADNFVNMHWISIFILKAPLDVIQTHLGKKFLKYHWKKYNSGYFSDPWLFMNTYDQDIYPELKYYSNKEFLFSQKNHWETSETLAYAK